jgi:signal transduction histidine kinase
MKNLESTVSASVETITQLRRRVAELEAAELRRQKMENELLARAQQQAIVAELGQYVLTGPDLAVLLNETATLVAQTLQVEFCQILELMPNQDILLLRAGVGWQPGLVGQATADARPDSHVGYTLFSSEPVIVTNLKSDARFSESSLLHEHGVVSGVSVIVDGEQWPFGVLSIHTSTSRLFTQDDIHFLQSVANLLATAVEHKRAQEALQEAHNELERRVKERTIDLQMANEELKTFAYIISHDLRAPLVNVKGFTTELKYSLDNLKTIINPLVPHLEEHDKQELTTTLHGDIPEALGFIDSSVNRMNNLINAILKLSRLGRRDLYFEPIEVESLIRTILETLAHQIEQRQVTVTLGSLPKVVADRTALEQIMANILTNAVNYLEAQRPGEIEITAETAPTETIFHIRDNGRGIAAEDMHKVFELFRRAGRQDVAGEGMGLAYVRALVRRHGGYIWCDSEPGVGTTFSFTLSNQLKQGETHAERTSS